jgi:hypothetical protein
MDPVTVFPIIQNLGALGILALMVIKSPAIVTALGNILERNMVHVRETQSETLAVFKSENDKTLQMVSERFKTIEEVLHASVETQTAVLGEMKTLAERVGALEREKSYKNAS